MPYTDGPEALQWAREATKGTDLATTSKMLVTSFQPVPEDEFYRGRIVRGLMQRNRGFETPVKRWTSWTAGGPVSYEQLQNWLGAAIHEDAIPTGASPYVWTHTRNPAAIPTLSALTFERLITDGSTPIQQAWHYGLVQQLVIRFVDGEPLTFRASGVARRVQTETLTAAITLPTPEIPPAPLATLFIDSTWANPGTTQVSSQILEFELEINTGQKPIWTADGRTDLDYTLDAVDPDEVSVNARTKALVGAQTATEKTAAEAATLRAVQVSLAGSGGRALDLKMLGVHEKASVFEFEMQDGQKAVTYNLQSTDGTNLLEAVLTNLVATYDA